jgi:sortase A
MLRIVSALSATALGLTLAACSSPGAPRPESGAPRAAASAPATPDPTLRARPPERVAEEPDRAERLASDGRPRRARLSVPAIGVRGLRVVPYVGRPDDAPGTRIQDGGVAASPHGPAAGVGPGGIGNYIVTAHRTSSTRAFAELPSLRRGDRVHVVVGGTRYTYRVVRTRWTSFRSQRSLRRQAAAVPGHPGREPRRSMITLSTCATPEDHARGNYWSDEFGNPEHRIDKIGVLVATRPA